MHIFCYQIICAEVKVANFMVEHNIPLAVSDHLSPLLREIFPDSGIAKKYASCQTKTTCMLNMAVAPHFMVRRKCTHLLMFSYIIILLSHTHAHAMYSFSRG